MTTTDKTTAYRFLDRPLTNGTVNPEGDLVSTSIFNVTTRAIDETKYIEVAITRKSTNSCNAELFTTVQHLYPATVNYTLSLKGQKATFLPNSTWRNDSVVEQLYVHRFAST